MKNADSFPAASAVLRRHTSFFQPPGQAPHPIRYVGWGEEIRNTIRYRWHGLRRGQAGCVLWQLTLGGEGRILIGGGDRKEEVVMREGQCFLVRIPSDHCYYYKKGAEPWHFIWAMWGGAAAVPIYDALNRTPVRTFWMNPESAEVRSFRHLLRTRGEAAPHLPAESVESYRFLLHLSGLAEGGGLGAHARAFRIDRLQTKSAMPSQKLDGKQDTSGDIVTAASSALRQHPAAAIGKGNGLAEQVGMSRFQLYRAIRRSAGLSPKEWRAQERLGEACRLLRGTVQPVAEIAVRIGMPDANYFARFFRKRTGLTPRDWRKLFGESNLDQLSE